MGIDFAEDTREQIDDMGQTCTIGSDSRRKIPCIVGDERRTADIEPESGIEVFERELTMMTADVSAIPRQNSTVVFASVRYYIYDIQHDTEAGSLLLYLRRNADGRIT